MQLYIPEVYATHLGPLENRKFVLLIVHFPFWPWGGIVFPPKGGESLLFIDDPWARLDMLLQP